MDSGDTMNIEEKLGILTDAAKYDVSCSSSNSNRKNQGGIGNAHVSGICHSWSEDGRCISLLKILLTNDCVYDCVYCINRRSADTPRAEFTPEEVAQLTIEFYKRNYIEGLFLSSAVSKNPDDTMEKMIRVAKLLRKVHQFYGYIHMKAIPGASPSLIQEMGLYIDRMSVNIEMPTESSLKLLAPQKSYESIYRPMLAIGGGIEQNVAERKQFRQAPKFVPAGQTTQMIVGAAREDDYTILQRTQSLYDDYKMKRVYYSGFVPAVASPLTEGIVKPPLLREHRIYQGDFLMRFYGFHSTEILSQKNPFFDLYLDPKANWAIENIHLFPMEINRATYEELLRIPGFGPKSAQKIIQARRFAALSYDGLKSLKISTKRARNFITVGGVYRGGNFSSPDLLRESMRNADPDNYQQLSFFR